MIEKNLKTQPIVKLLIFTLITICCWIGFDIWRALSKKGAPDLNEDIIKTFNPNLDTKTIEELKNRFSPTEEDLRKIPEGQASPSASPKNPS